MIKLKGFEAKVINGSLWLIKPWEITKTPLHPACCYDVRVRIGANGEAHSIEARVVTLGREQGATCVETIHGEKMVRCTTLAAMENEAAKLAEWGANWKSKKMMKGWQDMMDLARKEGRVKAL